MRKWSELSEKEKREIEQRYSKGENPSEIAKDYGLKPKQISDQAYRKKWKTVKTSHTRSKGTKGKTKKSSKKSKKQNKKTKKK